MQVVFDTNSYRQLAAGLSTGVSFVAFRKPKKLVLVKLGNMRLKELKA